MKSGYGLGMTPLLDTNGKPIVSKMDDETYNKANYIHKTLTEKNGVIHWTWICSRILLIFMMNIFINGIHRV